MNAYETCQKGFIPIIAIVIALVLIASAGAGVVLERRGKLQEITATVAEVFRGAGEDKAKAPEVPQKQQGQEQEQKEVQPDQASVAGEQAVSHNASAEKARQETEEARLEAERLRLEAERARAQAEQELQRQQEAYVETQRRQQELQNQQLKIEKCKADAQKKVDALKSELSSLSIRYQEAFKQNEKSIRGLDYAYFDCEYEAVNYFSEDMVGLSPSQQNSIWEAKQRACTPYLEQAKELRRRLELEKEQANSLLNTGNALAEQRYSEYYDECLNRL